MTLAINKFSKSSNFADWGLYFLAFLMGVGFLKLELGAIGLVAILFAKDYLNNGLSQARHPWLYFAGGLLGAFLWFYWWDYVPYKPEMHVFEEHYFKKIFAWSLIALVLPLFCCSARSLFSLMWFTAMGSFIYAIATSIATFWLLSPPYYNRVIDLRSLILGAMTMGNSPGISNLLCFVPVVFSAGLLLDRGDRPTGMLWMGMILSLAAIFAAIQFQQRTFFLLVLVVQPIIIVLLLMVLKRYRKGLIVLCICLIYPGLLLLEEGLGFAILPRKLDANLMTDARLVMFRHWLSHVWIDPWSRVEVGPAPWDSLYWFHNYFADVHRLSGLRATLTAGAFLGALFIRTTCLLWWRPAWGAFLLAVALPTFMIANSSVVPEGERQPFLLLILMYSICECLLWQIRKKSPLSQA